jgi:hypothetical protein
MRIGAALRYAWRRSQLSLPLSHVRNKSKNKRKRKRKLKRSTQLGQKAVLMVAVGAVCPREILAQWSRGGSGGGKESHQQQQQEEEEEEGRGAEEHPLATLHDMSNVMIQ